MSLKSTVAAEIRAELGRQRKTQKEVAEALSVSQCHASHLINGVRAIDLDQLEAVATFLNVDAITLFRWKGVQR